MPRVCPLCGRPKDADHHDIVEIIDHEATMRARIDGNVEPGEFVWKPAPPGWPNRWACRTDLVATINGKTFPARDAQRIKQTDTRFVHRDRLEALNV